MTSFNVEKFVIWKRKMKNYSFLELPKTVIISAQESSFKKNINIFTKKVYGIKGTHYKLSDNVLLSTNFGVGAPALITLCEELRMLGVENFYFIGIAGRLANEIQEAEIFKINQAISELGITKSYLDKEILSCSLEVKLPFNIKEAISWSTDAPFRETVDKILYYKKLKATLVDMESASLYSFAEFYNLKALCFLVGADLNTENEWIESKKIDKIEQNLQLITKLIISQI